MKIKRHINYKLPGHLLHRWIVLFPSSSLILFVKAAQTESTGAQAQSKIHKYLIKVRYFCTLAGQSMGAKCTWGLQLITCDRGFTRLQFMEQRRKKRQENQIVKIFDGPNISCILTYPTCLAVILHDVLLRPFPPHEIYMQVLTINDEVAGPLKIQVKQFTVRA